MDMDTYDIIEKLECAKLSFSNAGGRIPRIFNRAIGQLDEAIAGLEKILNEE